MSGAVAEWIEATARHMSFTLAAEELHVTPAALSYQVRQLEDILGVKLFKRLNRAIAALAAERNLTFVDLYPAFLGDDGSIRDDLTYDELHLSGAGYRVWQEQLEPFLRN